VDAYFAQLIITGVREAEIELVNDRHHITKWTAEVTEEDSKVVRAFACLL